MINDLLKNKNAKERADIKVKEILKLNLAGVFEESKYGFKIEIRDVSKIAGGIQFFARAWEGTEQLGFGKDGSVEWERFRIYNPPILVDDPNSNIIREWTERNSKTGIETLRTRKLREDPIQAVRSTLAHTIKVSHKGSGRVVAGKVGNTVSTFFPDADPETTSVDGYSSYWDNFNGIAWSTIRNAATTPDGSPSAGAMMQVSIEADNAANWDRMARIFILFDTSALTAGATITAATISLFETAATREDTLLPSQLIDIVSSSPASNTNLVVDDYDQLGTTSFAAIDITSLTANAYNDFSLDANGLANISKTAISKFGARVSGDTSNTEPTFGADQAALVEFNAADAAGTANDPKLVVTYTTPVTFVPRVMFF